MLGCNTVRSVKCETDNFSDSLILGYNFRSSEPKLMFDGFTDPPCTADAYPIIIFEDFGRENFSLFGNDSVPTLALGCTVDRVPEFC